MNEIEKRLRALFDQIAAPTDVAGLIQSPPSQLPLSRLRWAAMVAVPTLAVAALVVGVVVLRNDAAPVQSLPPGSGTLAGTTSSTVDQGDTTLAPGSGTPAATTSSTLDQGDTTLPVDGFGFFAEPQPVDLLLSRVLGSIETSRVLYVHKCMAAYGFPQLLELDAMIGGPKSDPNNFWRVETGLFGPDTEAQARQFGFLGASYWDHQGEEGIGVVSSDPDYDTAAEVCYQEFSEALPQEGPFQTYSDLQFEIIQEIFVAMRESLEVDASAVFDEWLGCIETAGFTPQGIQLTFGVGGIGVEEAGAPEVTIGGSSALAQYFGVQAGDWEGAREPDNSPLPEGTTEIRQGGSLGVYVPTEAEVELALADVACKQQTRFWERLYPILMDIQRRVMADFEDQLTELNPQIEELAQRAQDFAQERASTPAG
jgi:hypothetical protein